MVAASIFQASSAESLSGLERVMLDLAIPFAATLVLTGIESLVESVGWQLRMVRAGWDLCVLSLGAGGILASPAMVKTWGDHAIEWALASTFLSTICGIV